MISVRNMNLYYRIFVRSCIYGDHSISFFFCYTYLCVEYYPGKSDYIVTPVDFATLGYVFLALPKFYRSFAIFSMSIDEYIARYWW